MKNFWKRLGAAAAALMTLTFAGCSSDKGGGSNTDISADSSLSSVSQMEDTASENKPENRPEDEPKEWHELNQREITEAMGMGWNLGNQLEASNAGVPSETAWGNPKISEDVIKLIKDQGFKTVRIPVSYLLKIGDAPDYEIDEEWLDRVRQVVDYVVDNDMFAVINIHGDGYYTVDNGWLLCVEDDEKQAEIKAKFEAVWTQIAERFKNYGERLIFESMNEVFDGTYGNPNEKGYENINAYNQIFVDAVRKTGANNTRRWLLMPGWNTNIEQTVGEYGFAIPRDDLCESAENRLMISVHFYDPYNFTLNENMSSAKTQWGKYAVENYDRQGQENHVENMMRRLNEVFVSRGYPVIIGEMGVQDKSHISETFGEFRRYWLEYVVNTAKKNGCIPIYWDNGYNGAKGFGLINRRSLTVTEPELIAAMIRAVSSDDYEIAAPAGFEQVQR